MRKFIKKIVEMNVIELYFITLLCHFMWLFAVGKILHNYEIEFSQNVASSLGYFSKELMSNIVLDFVCTLLEEMIFRWGPMILFGVCLWLVWKIVKIDNKLMSNIRKYGIVIIVMASSTIFGVLHGNVFNILLQGVSGLVFFMIYLRELYREKIKGKSDRCQIMPLMSSTLYHLLSNYVFLLL